jgi:hypothetical protein
MRDDRGGGLRGAGGRGRAVQGELTRALHPPRGPRPGARPGGAASLFGERKSSAEN